jgi:uncharacterized membrane protein
VAGFVPLFAWDVWEALGNLLGLPLFYDALGVGDSTPWVLLWVGVVLPIAVFLVAGVISLLFDSALERVLTFFTAWALVAALSLSMGSLEQAWRAGAI